MSISHQTWVSYSDVASHLNIDYDTARKIVKAQKKPKPVIMKFGDNNSTVRILRDSLSFFKLSDSYKKKICK